MRKSPAEWQCLVAKHQRSGVSVKEFCQKAGLSESALGYWSRKIRKQQGLMSSKTPAMIPEIVRDSVGAGAVLQFPSGIRMAVAPDFDLSSLQRLVAAVLGAAS